MELPTLHAFYYIDDINRYAGLPDVFCIILKKSEYIDLSQADLKGLMFMNRNVIMVFEMEDHAVDTNC
jgi:hypothetical protein